MWYDKALHRQTHVCTNEHSSFFTLPVGEYRFTWRNNISLCKFVLFVQAPNVVYPYPPLPPIEAPPSKSFNLDMKNPLRKHRNSAKLSHKNRLAARAQTAHDNQGCVAKFGTFFEWMLENPQSLVPFSSPTCSLRHDGVDVDIPKKLIKKM